MSRKSPHLGTIAAVASILVVAVSTAGSAIAPLAPSGLSVGSTTASSIAANWAAPADKSVVRFRLLLDGTVVGSTTSTHYTFANLTCGKTYDVGIASLDASEAVSSPVTVPATTDACSGGTPPPTTQPPTGSGEGSGPSNPPVSTSEGSRGSVSSKVAAATASTAVPSAASLGLSFYSPLDNNSWQAFQIPFCKNGQNPVDNANVHFGTYAFDSQIVGAGNDSVRLDLPAWSGGRTRCQLSTPRTVNAGTDDYYGLMFYLPAGWQPSAGFNGVQIAELNYQGLGDGTANVALDAHSDHITLALATGVATTVYPYAQYRSNADSPGKPNLPPLYAVPRPMQMGVWHELIVHVHWAANSSGQIDIWHRIKGQSAWTQTVAFSGYPTLKVNPNGSFPTRTNDVLQAYRLASTAPVSVWLDDFSRSTSFASVATTRP